MLSDQTTRFPWICGKEIGQAFGAMVMQETIQQTENRLAYARSQARTYSSYAAWAARLQDELAMLRRMQNG